MGAIADANNKLKQQNIENQTDVTANPAALSLQALYKSLSSTTSATEMKQLGAVFVACAATKHTTDVSKESAAETDKVITSLVETAIKATGNNDQKARKNALSTLHYHTDTLEPVKETFFSKISRKVDNILRL